MPPASPIFSLREEQRAMTTLLDVLKREQQCLIAADIDNLKAVTTEKTALVQQMSMLATQRHNALGAAGFPRKEAGMEAWLASCNDPQGLVLWRRLLEQTREAKELNRINGMLINRHVGHTQGALNALRPQAIANKVLYGPTGHATNPTGGRGFMAG